MYKICVFLQFTNFDSFLLFVLSFGKQEVKFQFISVSRVFLPNSQFTRVTKENMDTLYLLVSRSLARRLFQLDDMLQARVLLRFTNMLSLPVFHFWWMARMASNYLQLGFRLELKLGKLAGSHILNILAT